LTLLRSLCPGEHDDLANAVAGVPEVGDPLQALDQLQLSLKLTPAWARAWALAVRVERRAASARSEARGA